MPGNPVTETMEIVAAAYDEKYFAEEELKTGEEKYKWVFNLINDTVPYSDKSKKQTSQPPAPYS